MGPLTLDLGLGVVRERLVRFCRRNVAALLLRKGLDRDQRCLRHQKTVYRGSFPPRLQRHHRVPSQLRLSRPHDPLVQTPSMGVVGPVS